MLFDKFINSVAMAKTTFFSKTIKTQARFSPRRDVLAVLQKSRGQIDQKIKGVGCKFVGPFDEMRGLVSQKLVTRGHGSFVGCFSPGWRS